MRLAAALVALLPAAATAAEVLVVDPATSRVHIHLGRSGLAGFLGHAHEIEAPVAEGRIEVDADGADRSSVRLRFDAAELAIVPGTEPASDVPSVEIRMRGPEVLDVEQYPQVLFESSAISVSADGPSPAGPAPGPGPIRLLVRGTLHLRGHSAEVAIPVAVRRDPTGLVASGETWLELRALGIEPPSVAGLVKVANRFRLSFEIHASPHE